MQIFNELRNIPNLSLALGFFDGIHLGHRSVIKSAVNFAKLNNSKSAVITFDVQPYCYFNKTPQQYIIPRKDSYSEIEKLGIDYIFEINFESICKYTGAEYIDLLIDNLNPISISTGENHHFGSDNCSSDVIYNYQDRGKFRYYMIPSQKVNGSIVSSSSIRKYLLSGDIESANSMLFRKFSLSGEVISGNKFGREIGFPTINVKYPDNVVQIPYGVYKTSVQIEGSNLYDGILNFGVKPTVSSENIPLLEMNIFNFSQDLYGKNVRIIFDKLIRKEKKFESIEALKQQISIDINNSK